MKLKKLTSILIIIAITVFIPLNINAAVSDVKVTGLSDESGNCGADGDNVTYFYDSKSNTLTISGNGKMENYTDDIRAPWYEYQGQVYSIVIKDGVQSIGDYSFRSCSRATNVQIPSSVTNIGRSAFMGCRMIENIKIPSGVKKIERQTFLGSGLTSIEIPSNITSIGEYAFSQNYSLTNVKIPSSVTSIEKYAFEKCTALQEIELPSSITETSQGLFSRCSNLSQVKIPASVKTIGPSTFSQCTLLTDIEIPSSVERIETWAFSSTGLTNSIKIPRSVNFIGRQAFLDCTGLKSAYIYNDKLDFDSQVFHFVTDLTIYGYENSTADGYAHSNLHKFASITDSILQIKGNNGVADIEIIYDSPTTLTASSISIPSVDNKILLGLYTDKDLTNKFSGELELEEMTTLTLYSDWASVENLEAEVGDKTGSTQTTSGFDLFGAQFREKTDKYSTGLRFCTRVSKNLISEIESKTGNTTQLGYAICEKESVPENTELTVKMTTTDGKTAGEFQAPKTYYNGKNYLVYTAAVTNIPDNMESTDIVARPYIKYTDANGILRYYYFTENGASNCGGGYYTSYQAVVNAHTAAMIG